MSRVMIFPTDTVYGIGTPLFDKEGIERIYQIKGRDANKPMAVLINSFSSIEKYVVVTKSARKLANAFWPGALTMVLSTKAEYQAITGEKTLGIRKPDDGVAKSLISMYGPLKTTSVNISGQMPLNDYHEIKSQFEQLVDIIYQNVHPLKEIASTVVDLTQSEVVVLRAGSISLDDILKVLKG